MPRTYATTGVPGNTVTGTGVANEIAVWTSTTSIGGSNSFTFDGTDLLFQGTGGSNVIIFADIPAKAVAFGDYSGTSNETFLSVNDSASQIYGHSAGSIIWTNSLTPPDTLVIKDTNVYINQNDDDFSGSKLQVTGGIHNNALTEGTDSSIWTSQGGVFASMFSKSSDAGLEVNNGSADFSIVTSGATLQFFNNLIATEAMNISGNTNQFYLYGATDDGNGLALNVFNGGHFYGGMTYFGTGTFINLSGDGSYMLATAPTGFNAGFTASRPDSGQYASFDLLDNADPSTGWSFQMANDSTENLYIVDRVNNSNMITAFSGVGIAILGSLEVTGTFIDSTVSPGTSGQVLSSTVTGTAWTSLTPSKVAQTDLTSQGAAIAATTVYAVPASGAGAYRVSWVATVTRPATASSVLGGTNGFRILYTDGNDTQPKTTAAPVITSTGNSTATQISGVLLAYCLASTNLQYSFDYTSVGATTMQYAIHVRVESI